MATPLAPNDILVVKFYCQLGEQMGLNIRHMLCLSVGGSPATYEDLVANLATTYTPLYIALINDTAKFAGVSVQRIQPLPQTTPFPVIVGSTGLVGGGPLPGQISGLSTLRTARAGRRYRGRIYAPFPGQDDNAGNHIPTNDYLTRLATLSNALTNTYGVSLGGRTAGMQWVLWNQPTLTYTYLTTYRLRLVWATQRRRGSLGRPNPIGP